MMAGISDKLKINSIFNSVEEVKNAVSDFNTKSFVNFRVDINNKNTLRFICKHGAPLRSGSTGQRPLQHYNALKCKAVINFYKRQNDGKLKWTQFNTEHCQPVSERLYNLENVS